MLWKSKRGRILTRSTVRETNDEGNVVRTLWHGSALSLYERISLTSFVLCGHRVQVYSYDAVDVPKGVELCDAAEIVPTSSLFANTEGPGLGGFAAFSDLFRYKLLLDKGGIWSDLDVLCLKPLHRLPSICVGRQDEKLLNGAVFKATPGSAICRKLYEQAAQMGPNSARGQAGPRLITKIVKDDPSLCTVLDRNCFYPIHWTECFSLLEPEDLALCEARTRDSYCVHWWNTGIRVIHFPKDMLPPEGSFLWKEIRNLTAKGALGDVEIASWSAEELRHRVSQLKKPASA